MEKFAEVVAGGVLAVALAGTVLAEGQEEDRGTLWFEDGIGTGCVIPAGFRSIFFAPPGISEASWKALGEAGVDWHPMLVLAEKRLLEGVDPQAVPQGEVPAIVMEYHRAFPAGEGNAGGVLDTIADVVPAQRIGGHEVRELPCYPGPYGENAFCWLVKLPEGQNTPTGWLLLSAPRFFEAEDGGEEDGAAPRPTGYDRVLREMLETLGFGWEEEEAVSISPTCNRGDWDYEVHLKRGRGLFSWLVSPGATMGTKHDAFREAEQIRQFIETHLPVLRVRMDGWGRSKIKPGSSTSGRRTP